MPATWRVRHAADAPALVREAEAPPADADLVIEMAGCLLDPRDAELAADPQAGARYPLVPGRHVSGRVVAAGPAALTWVGKAVVVPELLPCGTCHPCRRALPLHCPDVVRPGVTHPGGLGDSLVVPARFVVPLEGALSWNGALADAALVGLFALGYQALASSGMSAGDVAVSAGDEALSQLLRAKGARLPGGEAPAAASRWFVRAGQAMPRVEAGAMVIAYGQRGALDLAVPDLWSAEATVRFVRACHPDLYPELLALMIRGDLALDAERIPFARADEALSLCASRPMLVVCD